MEQREITGLTEVKTAADLLLQHRQISVSLSLHKYGNLKHIDAQSKQKEEEEEEPMNCSVTITDDNEQWITQADIFTSISFRFMVKTHASDQLMAEVWKENHQP